MSPNQEIQRILPRVIGAFVVLFIATLVAVVVGVSGREAGCFLNKDKHIVCLDERGRVENSR